MSLISFQVLSAADAVLSVRSDNHTVPEGKYCRFRYWKHPYPSAASGSNQTPFVGFWLPARLYAAAVHHCTSLSSLVLMQYSVRRLAVFVHYDGAAHSKFGTHRCRRTVRSSLSCRRPGCSHVPNKCGTYACHGTPGTRPAHTTASAADIAAAHGRCAQYCKTVAVAPVPVNSIQIEAQRLPRLKLQLSENHRLRSAAARHNGTVESLRLHQIVAPEDERNTPCPPGTPRSIPLEYSCKAHTIGQNGLSPVGPMPALGLRRGMWHVWHMPEPRHRPHCLYSHTRPGG